MEISIYEKVYGTEGQPQVDTTGEESERLDSEIRLNNVVKWNN